MKPYQQGTLDSLCGIYSLINAAKLVLGKFNTEKSVELYEYCLTAVERRKGLVYVSLNGIGCRDLMYVFNEAIKKNYPVECRKPFRLKNTPESVYWSEIKNFLQEENRAVLACYEGNDWSHWTVVKAATEKKLILFDSVGRKQIQRRHAGIAMDDSDKPIILHPTWTYFFQRT